MHVTAPHSFNMLLQQRAKERRLSVISRKHSTTSAHFARKNWHNAAAQDHVTIQNGHRITTPAHCVHKIRTTPQRETTLRSKIATAPQRQHTLCTKFAPRHNGRPRYDPKWPPRHNASTLCAQNSQWRHNGRPRYDPKLSPRHTRALNHNVLLAQRE